MSRKFISLVVAASVAIAGLSASQAQAGDKRLRNVILGATALAILGAAASENNRAEAAPRYDTYGDGHTHGDGHTYYGRTHGRVDQDHRRPVPRVTPRPLPSRVAIGQLPRRCLVTVENRRETRTIYEKRCLERNYSRAASLPKSCHIKVRAGGRKIHGYPPRCLRRHNQLIAQRSGWINRH